ncbi:hypothetical protein [Shewanella maritima]|uniref:hypothetical protein n=1 Tax=Shewanella maritima TaxID=2520507 RepID=UPI003736552B
MSKKLLSLLIAGVLLGCGSSDDSPETQTQQPDPTPAPTVLSGQFLDSAVIGIGYRTETQSGFTDENGNYDYVEGETVTFFIGDLEFPATTATGTVTPLNIAMTEDVTDNLVVNMTRLLQTLDQDDDPSNGITITETAAASAAPVDFAQDVEDFAADADVLATVQNGGQDETVTELIPEDEAIDHLTDTIAENDIQVGIVGSWSLEDENDLLHLVFFNDGTYTHMEVDQDDLEEASGMEWGTYTRDADTNRLTAMQTFDGNGDTGLTDFVTADGAPEIFAKVMEGQLMFDIDESADGNIDETLTFTANGSDGIVGTWLADSYDDGTADENDLLMFVFKSDGTYIHTEVDMDDQDETSGMEWGTYSIDSTTNRATVTQTYDDNGDTGLTDFSTIEGAQLFITVDGDVLSATFDEDADGVMDGMLTFNRQ